MDRKLQYRDNITGKIITLATSGTFEEDYTLFIPRKNGTLVTREEMEEVVTRIAAIDAGSITSGKLDNERLNSATTTTAGIVLLNNTLTSTSILEALTAAQGKVLNDAIASVSLVATNALNKANTINVTDLDASVIKTGTISISRLPALAANNVTSGVFHPERLPDATTTVKGGVILNNTLTSESDLQALSASQGKVLKDLIDNIGQTANAALSSSEGIDISNIDASTITTGVMAGARLPQATNTVKGIVLINDTLTETSSLQALSANQGRNLKSLIDDLNSTITTVTESVDAIDLTNLEASSIKTGTISFERLPTASELNTGVVKLNNTLTSDSVAEALSAAQGKALKLLIDQTSTTANEALATADSIDLHSLSADDVISGVFAAERLPTASTTVSGIVTLNNTLTSDSVTEALTAAQGKSLKESIDSLTGGGAAVNVGNDVATDAEYFPMLSTLVDGLLTNTKVANTKLTFNPSTGTLSTTVLNMLSDVNYKKDIVTAPSDVISKLRGVEFKWKDGNGESSGVIAQEIEQVLPHVVTTSAHGKKTVNYQAITAYMIETIKELTTRIEKLESK